MTYCLPRYKFHILDENGWNFRHAIYHEENRRTLVKAYGMKFLINVNGNAGKFDATRSIVIIVTGLGLMGLANILCDFVLLKSSNQYRETIAEKKYEYVNTGKGVGSMVNILANSTPTPSASPAPLHHKSSPALSQNITTENDSPLHHKSTPNLIRHKSTKSITFQMA